jgi:hypothetical protein
MKGSLSIVSLLSLAAKVVLENGDGGILWIAQNSIPKYTGQKYFVLPFFCTQQACLVNSNKEGKSLSIVTHSLNRFSFSRSSLAAKVVLGNADGAIQWMAPGAIQ